ncbi:Translocon at the outer membrane of chloroplasts 64 [Euphorbia peplus]|nr:Translocon at the outer membrane of chloroplasts 64 [Euphorbia peplus]
MQIYFRSQNHHTILRPKKSWCDCERKGKSSIQNFSGRKPLSIIDAIKLNGNNATYYSNTVATYLEPESFLQAEDDCAKAISLDKKVTCYWI